MREVKEGFGGKPQMKLDAHPVISRSYRPALLGLIVCIITLAGCTGGRKALVDSPTYRNRRAKALLNRSVTQLRNGEFTPALTDAVMAERFCEDESLLAEIHLHREYMLNRMNLFTSVEEGDTLRYTLLYKRDEIFHAVDNLKVRFTFVKGSGIMEESARTDTKGTVRSKIEKLNGLRSKFIIESVPVVITGAEEVRIEELRYNFILNDTGIGDRPNLEHITDVFLDTIDLSVEVIDQILEDLFED